MLPTAPTLSTNDYNSSDDESSLVMEYEIKRDYQDQSDLARQSSSPIVPTQSNTECKPTKSLMNQEGSSKTRFVLSIDGGGIRGIIPGSILSSLEREIAQIIAKHFDDMGEKPPVHNFCLTSCFDLVAGTSTGGIIALGAGISTNGGRFEFKYNAGDLGDLYTKNGATIFSKEFKHNKLREFLTSSRYDPAGLETVMQQYFGDYKLSDLVTPVLVTSFDLNRQELVVFDSEKARPKGELSKKQLPPDYYCRDIALATSAAPTFFPIRTIESINDPSDKHDYIDGAVTANNPTMLAYVRAKKMFPGDHIHVVSLGCGYENIERPTLEGKIEWAKTISNLMITGASNLTESLMQQMIELSPNDKYWRIDIKLSEAYLDVTTDDFLKSLKVLGTSLRTNDDNAYKNIRDSILDFYASKRYYTSFRLIEEVEQQLHSLKYRKGGKIRIDLSDKGITPIVVWEVIHFLKSETSEKLYRLDLSGNTINIAMLEQVLTLKTSEAPPKQQKKHHSITTTEKKQRLEEEQTSLITKLVLRDCKLTGQELAWLVNMGHIYEKLDLVGSVKCSECDAGFLDSLCILAEREGVILEARAWWMIGNHYRYFEKFEKARKAFTKGSSLGDIDCEYLECLMAFYMDDKVPIEHKNASLHELIKKRNERASFMLGLAIEYKNWQITTEKDMPPLPIEEDTLPNEFVDYEIEHYHALAIDWYVRVSQSISNNDSSLGWITKAKNRLLSKTLLPAANSPLLQNKMKLEEHLMTKKQKKEKKKKEKQELKEKKKNEKKSK